MNRWLEEIRYFRAGIFNTGLSYVLFTLVLQVSGSVLLALLIVSIIGSIISYNTNKYYVFRRKNEKSFLYFGCLQFSIICTNWILLHLATQIGYSRNFIQLFLAVAFAGLNYIICKKFIFKS